MFLEMFFFFFFQFPAKNKSILLHKLRPKISTWSGHSGRRRGKNSYNWNTHSTENIVNDNSFSNNSGWFNARNSQSQRGCSDIASWIIWCHNYIFNINDADRQTLLVLKEKIECRQKKRTKKKNWKIIWNHVHESCSRKHCCTFCHAWMYKCKRRYV